MTTALVASRTSAAEDGSHTHHDHQQTTKMGRPYLDENGSICQDKMEMMEHVEYDKQIMCKVKMKEQCQDEYEEEGGLCHTVNVKKCQTEYKPSTTKVKVRVCPDGVDLDEESKQKMQDNSVVIDVRPTPVPKFTRQAKCVNGKRALCVTKYETMCTNKEVEYEMMEDHPRCRVELIEKCEENKRQKKRDDNVLSQMMAQMKPKEKNCSKIPAMRCRIEKMKVMKKKPETKCERMPRQFCRKEDCNDPVPAAAAVAEAEATSLTSIMDESLCYFRIQMVNEIVPRRTCRYTPRRVCPSRARARKSFDWLSDDSKEKHGYMAESTEERDHMVRMSRKFFASPRKCEQVPEEVCQSYRVNPRPVMKEIKRKVCRRPETEASSYDRSLVERLQEWAKVSVGGSPP